MILYQAPRPLYRRASTYQRALSEPVYHPLTGRAHRLTLRQRSLLLLLDGWRTVEECRRILNANDFQISSDVVVLANLGLLYPCYHHRAAA